MGVAPSNATALMSRNAGICYETLEQIFDEYTVEQDIRKYEPALLKAMLVHGCSWGDIGNRLITILNNTGNVERAKRLACNWLGYGVPSIERVLECTEQRATLLGFGEITDGQAHIFSLPLPPSLGARRDRRRLTVTLAWLSPSPLTLKNTVVRVYGLNLKVIHLHSIEMYKRHVAAKIVGALYARELCNMKFLLEKKPKL